MKWKILKSPANLTILDYLCLRYEETPTGIIFEGDRERELPRIASALRLLGYARDQYEAHRLAASFFINPVS
jgi:hypothetical protein